MEEFFGKALGAVSGNDGVMPIVIMFVFALGMTLILSKTIKLNQKQSYVILSMVFVGMMLFLIGLYAMFLKPNAKSETNTTSSTKVKSHESFQDINESNLSLSGDIEANKSFNRINNSSITFK